MKHGRRHARLKEQAYLDRKDAPGYARPFDALPLAADDPFRERAPSAPPAPPSTLGSALAKRDRRALKRLGIDPSTSDP